MRKVIAAKTARVEREVDSRLFALIRALLQRQIAFVPAFAELLGSVNAGLMLSQAYYWSERTTSVDGFFYKTADQWQQETRLSRREQEVARRLLRGHEARFWREERRGVPAKMFFYLDLERLYSALVQYGGNRQTSLHDTGILERRKTPEQNGAKRQACMAQTAKHLSLSEITSERVRSLTPSQDTSTVLVQNVETASGPRIAIPKKLCKVPRFRDSRREDLYAAIYRKDIENALLDCRRMRLEDALCEACRQAALSLTTNRSGIMLTVDYRALATSVFDRLKNNLAVFQEISNFDSRSRHMMEAIVSATIDAAIPLCSESRKEQKQTAFGF
jgi:hypothetical protein